MCKDHILHSVQICSLCTEKPETATATAGDHLVSEEILTTEEPSESRSTQPSAVVVAAKKFYSGRSIQKPSRYAS